MRYYALATDYDGTLAHNGKVDDGTYAALERLRTTRRKLILVTGRRLDDLMTVFDRIEIFDRAVLRNDAIEDLDAIEDSHEVVEPAAGHQDELAPRRPQAFECRIGAVVHLTVVRERAVVVRRERVIAHVSSLVVRLILRWSSYKYIRGVAMRQRQRQ